MKELIKISETTNGKAVSARELHQFLIQDAKGGQKGEMFAHWIKRMLEYGFEENTDYSIFEFDYKGAEISKSENQQVSKRDYVLTIDCAKEISMIQRNDKGAIARKYFIQKEKEALNPYANISKLEALRIAVDSEERNQLLEEQIKIQAPKVAYVNKVLDSKSTYVTNQIAKELGTSAVTLNRQLAKNRIIYKQNDTWMLYSKYQNNGYTKTKTYTYTDSEGSQKTSMQLVWTEKGREFIHSQMSKFRLQAV
jgi:anti-repressor protein